MTVRKKTLIQIPLLVAFTAMLSAAPPDIKGNLGGFDAFMAKAMLDLKVPGAAISIVHDGKILLAKGYVTATLPRNCRLQERHSSLSPRSQNH